MDKRIALVLNYIEQNPQEDLTLRKLAAQACLSLPHFHRLFKQATGQTPFRYVESIRMKMAYELVVAGEVGVQELAIKFNYSDYETFTRAFKKHFELAPHDMRVLAQKLKSEAPHSEDILIATVSSQEEVEPLIKDLIKQKRLQPQDLQEARAFKVEPKTKLSLKESLINNKYELVMDQSIIDSLKGK